MRENIAKLIVIVVFLALVVGGGFFFYRLIQREYFPIPTPTKEVIAGPTKSLAGKSVAGRDIEIYTFGNGSTKLLFVGGIHGGYEWNSTLLAYRFIDYLTANPEILPTSLSVSIIPAANPDGLYKATGKVGRFAVSDVSIDEAVLASGRFNTNGVDLNRNFDCKWAPESSWRGQTVSAGTEAFSEPEAQAVRNAVDKLKPKAVVFWHSQANAVYASECENGILPGTRTLMNTYAGASGYPAVDTFDAYAITGDAEGWLASINIPAVTVELANHNSVEWEKNLAGVKALFEYYD